jgi:hypothetical protein
MLKLSQSFSIFGGVPMQKIIHVMQQKRKPHLDFFQLYQGFYPFSLNTYEKPMRLCAQRSPPGGCSAGMR